MPDLKKCFTALCATFLFGCATVVPGSADADRKLADARDMLKQAAASFDKTLPTLVASGDYWTASNVAFLLANARSRLDQTPAACKALSQSLEYYKKALYNDTGIKEMDMGTTINEDSSGMADIRSRFGCVVPRNGSPA
jgi:hypothetical protein